MDSSGVIIVAVAFLATVVMIWQVESRSKRDSRDLKVKLHELEDRLDLLQKQLSKKTHK